MINPTSLCQIEIHTSQVKESLDFYHEVFGWRRAPCEIHNYIVLDVPVDLPYGIALVPVPSPPRKGAANLVLYFDCKDPEALIAKAESHGGGRKKMGPLPLASYGTLYHLEDLNGIKWGLFKR